MESGLHHLIPDPAHSFDEFRILPELFPQMPYVYIHSPCLSIELIAPKLIEQYVPCTDLADMLSQEFQDFEFFEG